MGKYCASLGVLKGPWDQVFAAFWQRYPNPYRCVGACPPPPPGAFPRPSALLPLPRVTAHPPPQQTPRRGALPRCPAGPGPLGWVLSAGRSRGSRFPLSLKPTAFFVPAPAQSLAVPSPGNGGFSWSRI